MQPHYSQSSREDATPSSGTSPLASYKEVHYGQLEIKILITVCFVTPSFALVPSLPECEKRSLMTRIKLWCTVIAVSIHVTSGVIFLRFFVFPKWCVQVGTVEVHMSCVRIQLHWRKNNIVKGKTWRTSCKKKTTTTTTATFYMPTSSPGRFPLALEVGREKALALAGQMTAPPPKPGESALGTRLFAFTLL